MENRIKMLRKEAGISQKQLGDALGVAQTTISAWESGRNEPDYDSIRKMAEILYTSADYLMGYSNEDTSEELDTLNITKTQKEKLARSMRRDRFSNVPPDDYEEQYDPVAMEYQEEKEEKEIEDTWQKTGKEVYRESAEIDMIFDQRNVDRKDRKRAVEVIKIMFPNK